MRIVFPGIGVLSVILLSACDQNPAPPAVVDIEVAAKTWNTPEKTWSEPDLHLLEEGRYLYQRKCAACHLSSGEGQQSFGAPALQGSAVVKGPVDALTAVVLDGRNSMPAFRNSVDAPSMVAILTYVRNAWGNNTADVVEAAAVESQ